MTGATGSLGQAVALAAAKAGGQLILAAKTPRKLNRLYDQIVNAGASEPVNLPVDLTGAGPEEFAQVAEAIGQQFGRLDGLVHLANSFHGLTPLGSLKPQDWAESLHLALNTPFLLHQALLPLLQEAEQARVVFALNSLEQSGKAYWGGYGVAQFALRGLLTILADELESSSVNVLGVQPPPVRSRLRQNIYMGPDPAEPISPQQAADYWLYALQADLADGCIVTAPD